MTDIHFLALDGGGTGCRAVLCTVDGRERGRAEGDAANLTSDFQAARDNILTTISNTYRAAGMPESAIAQGIAVLGVAGAEFGDNAKDLEVLLGFAKSRVLSDRDTTIAGVLGSGDGTLAQIGTGSFFVTRCEGETRHTGGWGLVLGDECSGAWLGRELLRATLRTYDGHDKGSSLTLSVLSDFDYDPRQIVLFARDATATDFAAYAPRLFAAAAAGDSVADGIVQSSLRELEKTLTALEGESLPPLYLCGGVGTRYIPLVSHTFRERLETPKGDGLSGALSLAMALHTDS